MVKCLLGTGMETLGLEHIAKTDVLNSLSMNQIFSQQAGTMMLKQRLHTLFL